MTRTPLGPVRDGPAGPDLELLLELYGRAPSPQAAGDLTSRVMDAIAAAAPELIVRRPRPLWGRRALPGMPQLPAGSRRLATRFMLVAVLSAALGAAALAAESHRSTGPSLEAPGLAPQAPSEQPRPSPRLSPTGSAPLIEIVDLDQLPPPEDRDDRDDLEAPEPREEQADDDDDRERSEARSVEAGSADEEAPDDELDSDP